MKKANLLKAGLMLMLTATVFTACKKDKEDNGGNYNNKIVGTWAMDFQATDDNENGNLDDAEKNYLDEEDFNIVTFSAGGTLEDSFSIGGFSGVIPGTWSIFSNNQLVVNMLGASDTSTILQLDGSSLLIKDNETPTSWTNYKKK